MITGSNKFIVIADDFSGAAEIAGIGKRFGLNAEVQIELDLSTTANLVVINSDTRALPEASAVKKIESLALQLDQFGIDSGLFLKVDSALRGHIKAEIETLVQQLRLQRAILLPANPDKGRTINNGHYYLDGLPLNESVFKDDPVFPAKNSDVVQVLGGTNNIHHLSVTASIGDYFPAANNSLKSKAQREIDIIIGDLTCRDDFSTYLRQTTPADLICGAAECFNSYLEIKLASQLERSDKKTDKVLSSANNARWKLSRTYTLIINGSTIQHAVESSQLKGGADSVFVLPGAWQEKRFAINDEELQRWQRTVAEKLLATGVASIAIGQVVVSSPKNSLFFEQCFVDLINVIKSFVPISKLAIGLTGGATACGVLKALGVNQLSVAGELAAGVVCLTSESYPALITVKPGSYLWPEHFLNPV